MIRILHLLALAAAALIAQACAGPQWTKAGADAAAVSRDLDDCRAVALRRAAPAVAPSSSPQAVTDRGRSTNPLTASAGSNERFIDEREEVNRCMAKRGYELRRPG